MEIKNLVEMVIGLVVVIALIPSVLTDWYAVNQTGWSAGLGTMWDVMPIIIVAGLVVAYAKFKK